MNDKISGRLNYIDITKGIAMLAVIAGHMGIEAIDKIIYPFHMPLFFLISGYFINDKVMVNDYIKKRAKQLLIPYGVSCIGICILSVLSNLVLGNVNIIWSDLGKWIYASFYGSCFDHSSPFYIKGIGIIWFLVALLVAQIVVKFFIAFKYGCIYIILLGCLGVITAKYIWLPFSMQAGVAAAVYVYAGYCIHKHNILEKIKGISFFFISMIVWLFQMSYGIRVDMSRCSFDGIFSIIGGAIICYSIVIVSKFIDSKFYILKNVFIFYGRNSLVILCFHEWETYMFPWSYVYAVFHFLGLPSFLTETGILIFKILFSTIGTLVVLKLYQIFSVSKMPNKLKWN